MVAFALVAVFSSASFSATWWSPGCSAGAGGPATLTSSGTLNSDSRIEYSMSGPNEGPLHGVPSSWDWAQHPVVDDANDAVGYPAVTGWGVVYAAANANEPAAGSVRVEFKNMQLYVWSRSGRRWVQVQNTPQVSGGHFAEDFANNAGIDADWRTEADGGSSSSMPAGYNLHFWPTGSRGTVNPGDVGAVYVTYQARLIGAGASSARYLTNAGADWWQSTTAPFPDNAGVGQGRFMYLSPSWQAFDFYSGGSYGPSASPPAFNWWGLALSNPPLDAMGRP